MSTRTRLTEASVEALTVDGRDRLILDSLLAGFGVRVTPSGTKLFVVRARVGGKPQRVTIGRFPDMKVADARREARAALDDMRAGKSPQIQKAVREAARAAGAMTVEALANRWMREVVEPKRKPLTIADYRRLVDQKIKPKFGSSMVASIKHGDVSAWHAEMAKTPRRANYAVAVLRAIMNFAERLELRPPHTNPVRGLELFPERQVERFMDEAEIARVAEAITALEDEKSIGPFAAAGLRLAMLTGARSGEIQTLRWEFINLPKRQIRLPDSKTGAKTIHLSPLAVEVIKSIPKVGDWVIAGAKPDKPYVRLNHAWDKVRERAKVEDVRLHDVRHSFASMAAARGFSLPMIGKLLGHKHAATTQRYAHLQVDVAASANDDVAGAIAEAMAKPAAKNTTSSGSNVIVIGKKRPRAKT